MYSLTYIQNGELFAITSPSLRTITRTFYNVRVKAGLNARLWNKSGKLIF